MTYPVTDQQLTPSTNALAIDIGGTKCSLTLFENSRISLGQTRATYREGGRAWMLSQIVRLPRILASRS